MQDSASFWTDIKRLDEQLAAAPDSLCFARLSEVYLKVGLIDDAIHIARAGVEQHPLFLSGQRALAYACHARGFDEEALTALQFISEVQPEDLESMKLLGRLYVQADDHEAAVQVFRSALAFAPDDTECAMELEALVRTADTDGYGFDLHEEDDEIIEDLEMLDDDEFPEESQPELEIISHVPDSGAQESLVAVHQDPLSTSTIAELYVSQGFIHKALEIYRAILVDNPEHHATNQRIVELEAIESGAVAGESAEAVFDVDDAAASGIDSDSTIAAEVTAPEQPQDFNEAAGNQSDAIGLPESPRELGDAIVQLNGTADNALEQLDRMLDNIGRIKSCR